MLEALTKYSFLQNALIAGILASVLCGIIGVIITEKKLLIMSGGIAHTAYGGVGLGYLLGFEPIIGAGIFSVAAALIIGTVRRKNTAHSDIIISLLWSLGMAAGIAFKEGIPQTSPVLLEPIGTLKVLVPDEMLGDVIGDINKRRGRIIGMNPAENKMQEIIGEVPMAEMSDFSTAMRSITQGTATFALEMARYEEVPQNIAQKIIEAAK